MMLLKTPRNLLLFFMFSAAIIWVLQCSLLQNILGLDILETVIWGAQGAWGHAKHPPLSGWIGYFFSKISNHQDWSMYLAAQLCLLCGGYFTYKTARLFFDEYASCTSALLLFFLFYYTPSETKFSTYFVEIALQPVTVYSFFTAMRRKKWHNYALLGVCAGLGLLNKYSYGLLLLGLAIIFLTNKNYRTQLKTTGPYLTLALLFGMIFPHLQWLINHDFVCFKHVGSRMEQENDWFWPFIVLGATIYPFILQYIVLVVASYKKLEKKHPQYQVFKWIIILSLLPALLYFVLSISGKGVILMWLCSTVSFTGIGVVAIFPKKIDGQIFKKIYLLAWIYLGVTFLITSADLLYKSRPRLHTKPEAIVKPALEFWSKQCSTPIPVVAGPRWYAAVIENYAPNRPPACEFEDPVFEERYRKKIETQGALLIGKPQEINSFCKRMGFNTPPLHKITYSYQAIFGKKRYRNIHVALLERH